MSLLSEILCDDWKSALEHQKDTLLEIDAFLDSEEKAGKVVYPYKGKRFAALNATPLSTVRCVIVGQDPYPGIISSGEPCAQGLSFSVPSGEVMPASLKNIDKELVHSGCGTLGGDGDLTFWASQGVLLLNAVMTLRAGESNSHVNIGWERVTEAILKSVLTKAPNAVYLGFGRYAHKLYQKAGVPAEKQIKTSHPSPLGATKKAKNGEFVAFIGSGCFKEVNNRLNEQDVARISWGRKGV